MHIQINTDDLTERDRTILLALAGVLSDEDVFADEATTDTPVKTAAPKKRAARKPKEPALPTEADKERMREAIEEPPGSPSVFHDVPTFPSEEEPPKADPKELINDAAERAVKLIRAGKRDEVKGILDMLGLEKVTALKDSPEKVQDFLDAISKLED